MRHKLNILTTYLAHIVTMVIGFILMPYILHTVGESTYGTWLILNSIAGHTGLLYLGFGDAIARFTSKYHTEKDWTEMNRTASCISSVYLISGTLALLIGLVLAWLAPILHEWPEQSLSEVRWAIVLLALNAAISIGGSAYGGILMGIQRFDLERAIIIGVTVLRLVLTLLCLQTEYGLITLAVIFLVTTILENGVSCLLAYLYVPELSIRFKYLAKEVYQRCFSFSLYTFLSTIAQNLIYITDTIVIGFFLGPIAVVPYYIAARICDMIRIPVSQVGSVYLPKAGQLEAGQQLAELRTLVSRGFGMAFFLALSALIGCYFFSPLLIEVWIGSGYTESPLILLILLGGQVFALPTQLLRQVLTGTGYVKWPSLLYLLEAVANLILSLCLLPFYGIYGVAIGTFIPLLLVEIGLIIPLGMRRLNLSLRELAMTGLRPYFLPLGLITSYALLVDQLHPEASWLHIVSIFAGAVLTLAIGIGLMMWSERKSPQEESVPHNQSLAT